MVQTMSHIQTGAICENHRVSSALSSILNTTGIAHVSFLKIIITVKAKLAYSNYQSSTLEGTMFQSAILYRVTELSVFTPLKILPKILKIASPVISPPIATLFNCCVDSSIFPSAGKKAEVTPGLKKGADTEDSNYRPLSVLPAISKVLEDLMLVQLEPVNNIILHKLISAYRPGHSCQDVLLYVINQITKALDKGKYAGAIATDL